MILDLQIFFSLKKEFWETNSSMCMCIQNWEEKIGQFLLFFLAVRDLRVTLFEMRLYWGNFWEMVSKLGFQSERILEDRIRGNFKGNGVKVGLSTWKKTRRYKVGEIFGNLYQNWTLIWTSTRRYKVGGILGKLCQNGTLNLKEY